MSGARQKKAGESRPNDRAGFEERMAAELRQHAESLREEAERFEKAAQELADEEATRA